MDQEDKKIIFNILVDIYDDIQDSLDLKITKDFVCEKIESVINNSHDDFKFKVNTFKIENEIIKINYERSKNYCSINNNFTCRVDELRKIDNLKKLK